MKKLLPLLLLLATGAVHAQAPPTQLVVNCAPATPCTPSGPALTTTGDPAWLAYGSLNTNFTSVWNTVVLNTTGTGPYVLQTGGTLVNVNAGIPSFIDLRNAINLPPTSLAPCPPLSVMSNILVSFASPICNTTLSVSSIVAPNGGSITFTGTGTINASHINGTLVPPNSASDQAFTTAGISNGQWTTLPGCLDAAGNHLNYNTTTHQFLCGNTGGAATSLTSLTGMPSQAAYSVVNNKTGAGGVPTAESFPTIKGINIPTETLTVNNTTNFDATNSLYFTPGVTLTGTATAKASSAAGQIAPYSIYVSSDTMDSCAQVAGTCVQSQGSDVFLVVHNIGAGHSGGRNTIFTRTFVNGTPSAPPLVGYTGATFVLSGNSNLTGVGTNFGTYQGSLYSGNGNVICQNGATFLAICNSWEFDVALGYGASAAEKHGISIVQTNADQLNGVFESSALGLQSQESLRNSTFTADVQGATSGTLSVAITNGTYDFVMGDHEQRTVVVTGGTAADWSGDAQGALASGTPITTFGLDAPWTYGINFGCYGCYPAFYDRSTLIAMQTPGTGPTNARYARAGTGLDWSNVTFRTAEVLLPGFTLDPNGTITKLGRTASYPTWGTAGVLLAPAAVTITDSTVATGTKADEDFYAFPANTLAALNASVVITDAANVIFSAPLPGTNVTFTNSYAAKFLAGIKVLGSNTLINPSSNFNFGLCTGSCNGTNTIGNSTGPAVNTIVGTTTLNHNAGTMTTKIGDGTTSGNNTIGGASNQTIFAGTFESGGTAVTPASGTGACVAGGGYGTPHGGVQAGDFQCTGTTGASTVTLTLQTTGTAFVCNARDVTNPTTVTQTGARSATSVTFTFTSVSANDFISWSCPGAY